MSRGPRPERGIEIALVVPDLGPGGVQRVVVHLAREWDSRGKRVGVFTLYKARRAYELPHGVPSIEVWRATHPVRLLEELRVSIEPMRRRLVSRAPARPPGMGPPSRIAAATSVALCLPSLLRIRALRDAVLRSGARTVLGFCGSAAISTVMACRGRGPRVLVSERNDPARRRLEFPWDRLRTRYYREADVVTANSAGALRTLESYVPAEKLALVPNPVILPDEPPWPAPAAAARTVLAVGRLHPQKAHDVLLEAFARVAGRLPGWRLGVVGSGELEPALRAEAVRLGIAERVDWHGQVADPSPFYRGASVFALPSRYEGMPNAMLEAMSHGLPVVVSDASPGPLEIVRHEVNGLVVRVEDAGALGAAIERLAGDAHLAARLGQAARRSVSDFALSRVVDRWDEILDGPAEASAAGGPAPDPLRPVARRLGA